VPKDLLSFEDSAAYGAKLANVESVSSYPGVPRITDKIKSFETINVLEMDSQQAALTASIGSVLGGKRTFVPMSSANSVQEFHMLSHMRLPVVAANISGSLGVNTLNSGTSDVMGLRDSGWIIFLVESCQESLDTVIQAYKISEDKKVMLPSVVNIDVLSNMREVVDLPNEKTIKNFLPRAKLTDMNTKSKNSFNPAIDDLTEFKQDQQKSMSNALNIITAANEAWKKKFRRHYDLVEAYRTEDADRIIVGAGFNSSAIRQAVDELRSNGESVGFARLKVFRPFPEESLQKIISNAKKVGVIDNSISLGSHGVMFSEIRHMNEKCSSFISLNQLNSNVVKNAFNQMNSETTGTVFL
jgi:pyruvate/2-oxoacid:ferredoxin oxidoreductase alpha subunit